MAKVFILSIRFFLRTTIITCLLAIHGCVSYQPRAIDQVPFLIRAQTQRRANVTVTAAVLSADESKAVFDVPLYDKGVQPIWLEIRNEGIAALWFLPFGVDQNYFSPLEAAYKSRFLFSSDANRKMDRHFHKHGIGNYIPPGEVISGFVFTNLKQGTKAFNVDLVTNNHELRSFTFFIPVPGLRIDHQEVDFEALYADNRISSYDEAGLRKALESLPCCTTNKDGKENGDPLNLVIVGGSNDVYQTLIRAGWEETETVYSLSMLKTAFSFVFGTSYRHSPVSALYAYGRPQDSAFQKARRTIHERNHLRLWLSPMRLGETPVWVGQISRDIGVRFTTKTFATHKIDPDVDETRNYLIQDFWYSQGLRKYGYVKGVGAAPISASRKNLTGDPYFTDGYRAVLWVSNRPVALSQVEFIEWEIPPER